MSFDASKVWDGWFQSNPTPFELGVVLSTSCTTLSVDATLYR